MYDVSSHYDRLIDEGNDPVHDPRPLREYMDKWDGAEFINLLALDPTKSVLEIGVGSGRLAVRTAPLCGQLCGIDISPKSVSRAGENLASFSHVRLICADFLTYAFDCVFDTVYSSLTFMHIEDKERAISKVASILEHGGRFVLSIDKNAADCIDMGEYKITVFPDSPAHIRDCLLQAGFTVSGEFDSEFAHIFVAVKP